MVVRVSRVLAAVFLCCIAAEVLSGVQRPALSAPAACMPEGKAGLRYVCGAEHPEDLAHIPGTRWLITSGFSDGAGLKLIDTAADTLHRWYTGAPEQVHYDSQAWPDCPGPPDVARFNAHGIHLHDPQDGRRSLYVVNHGGRESIEIFSVETHGIADPGLVWKGCIVLPPGMAANSVSVFRDGTILATVLTLPGSTIADFVRGQNTGVVLQWRPGDSGFKSLPGTELPGNNGIEVSADDQEFYVVAFGLHAVYVYSRCNPRHPLRSAVAPGFMPDNIHWDDGQLLLAGMQLDEPACGGLRKVIDGKADEMRCHRGYAVAALDPAAMQFKVLAKSGPDPDFNGVSAAAIVNNELWLGSWQQPDRVAHRPLPRGPSLKAGARPHAP
ncbi:MAG: hypothetical protein KGL25_10660 [Gammaproteobacteria bacterium]|nr:hypothetical protein [Gammaproteobacteria bacterium]MDE2251849.1 hypothetical protein [Gammaproteobacteria bacterium]